MPANINDDYIHTQAKWEYTSNINYYLQNNIKNLINWTISTAFLLVTASMLIQVH